MKTQNKPFSDPWGLYQQIVRHVQNKHVAGKRVLDIGCGSGWIEDMLLEKGAKKIVGIDISESVIKKAKSRKLKNVQYKTATAIDLPFPKNSFDTVVCFEVLEHIPQNTEQKMFDEVYRVLKPGGQFFLSTPHKHWFIVIADPAWWLIKHRHYSLKNIRNYLSEAKLKENRLYVRGGVSTVFLLLSMYFAKWITHGRPLFYEKLLYSSRREYAKGNGIMNVFLHASKPR